MAKAWPARSLRRSARCSATQTRLVTRYAATGSTKKLARSTQTRSSTAMPRWKEITSSPPATCRTTALVITATPMPVRVGLYRGLSSTLCGLASPLAQRSKNG